MADLPPPSFSSDSQHLSCAHCEVSIPTLHCEDESLLYCSPCSSSLHSKKARAHHILTPLRLCDQCEVSPASLTCSLCGGSGIPLAFCLPCSSDLHLRKARSHHELIRISIFGETISASIPPLDLQGEVTSSPSAVRPCRTDLRQSKKNVNKQNNADVGGYDGNDDNSESKRGCHGNPTRRHNGLANSLQGSKSKKSSSDQEFKRDEEEVEEEEEERQRKPLMECQPLAVHDSKKKSGKENGKKKAKMNEKDGNQRYEKKKKKPEDEKKMNMKVKMNKKQKKKEEEDLNNRIKQENTSTLLQPGRTPIKKALPIARHHETIYLSDDDSSSESEDKYINTKKQQQEEKVNHEEYTSKGKDRNKENATLNGGNPNGRVLRNVQNRFAHDSDNDLFGESESESNRDTSEDDETYGTKKYRKGSVTLEAFVVNVEAEEEGQIRRDSGACSESQVEEGIHGRIRKMLELGLHPDTPDFEAQQALKNAQRLLTKHNLQQADVLKGSIESGKNVFEGGMRIVELRSQDKKHPGCVAHWLYSLARTVADYFDTQYFVQKRSTIQIVFYGIKQNVECTAYAFAATFNRIMKLSAEFVPTKMIISNQCKASKFSLSHSVHSRVSRMSYRTGLVEGLFETVKASKKQRDEVKKKKTHGKLEKNGELEYTKGSENKEYPGCHSSEGEETFPLCSEDSDDEDVKKPHGSSEEWEKGNSSAITALVIHSKKVAEDFLKEMKVKVRIRKQSNPIIWDREAFRKGKRDSKTIDIGQKALTGGRAKKRAR